MNREENSSANVAPIRPGTGQDAHKQQYLDYIGQCYDDYVKASGGTRPCVVLFTMADEEGGASTNYLIPEGEKHIPALYVACAFVSCMAQVSEWEREA